MFERHGFRTERRQETRCVVPAPVAAFWGEFAHRQGQDLARCVAAATRRIGWRADGGDLDDLVQEVYCRVLEGRVASAVGDWSTAQLWSYLNRTANSVVVDAVRCRCARKRGGAARADGDVGTADDRTVWAADEECASGPTPEDRLLARDGARALRRRVRQLGGAQGSRNLRILELSAVEGCTAAEISARLAGTLSPSSVHTILHRLRRQLASVGGAELSAAGV
jgi:RNA polymerase sigma factor (sigma-70 family)